MKNIPLGSKVAVITGASSGIGEMFARELAAKGYNLILVARRKQKLEELANEMNLKFKVSTEVILADLSEMTKIEELVTYFTEKEGIEVLVNNAGYGLLGNFVDIELSKQLKMIKVHSIASYCFSKAVLPAMLKNNKGFIINVSSLSGLMPKYGNVAYTVSKSFLIVFSQTLQEELRNTNIKIQALCPGMTVSEFHNKEKLPNFDKSSVPKKFWMTSEEVVRKSLKSLRKRKTIYVPGWKNRLSLRISNNFLIGAIIRYFISLRFRRNKE